MNTLLTILISTCLVTAPAFAGNTYNCIDAKTGEAAGKIGPSATEGKILYSHSQTSQEGWILSIDEDGKLYNADLMVRHGNPFYVGSVGYENFKLLVEISGRKLICD